MRRFIGRAEELEALAEVAATGAPGPVVAIVVGAPGSGKSRLLAEARGRSALAPAFTVVGYEPERNVPLAAASGLLRALGAVPERGSQVEAVLFDAARAAPLEPVRVFEAAHRAFRTLEPSLLVLDDVQWVDELSLALCNYLIRAAQDSGQRLVVFAATRPGGSALAIANALPSEQVSWIKLGPLSREEGIELVRDLDAGLDPALAVELWERSRGSPFWLEALTRSRGRVAGLSQVLTRQLRGAGADSAALVGLLAVAARPLSLPEVGALVGWPQPRLEAALRDLRDRGLVVETAGAAQAAHDLIRETAVAELPDDVRRRLHRRLAERLEVDAGSDLRLLGQALEHRRAAGLPTLDLALRTVRAPQRKLLGPEGVRLLAAIADEADPLDADALALHEEVALLAGDLAEHEEALARWSLVAERTQAPIRRASALLKASRAAHALARAEDARDLLTRSREVDVVDDVLELEQKTHDGEIRLWLEQRASEGPELTRDAVAAAGRLVARAGGVSALDPRARRAYLDALELEYEVAVQEADPETMLRSAEARAAAARGFDLESCLSAAVEASAGLRSLGRLPEAARQLRSVWSQAHRHVFPRLALDAGFWLARVLQVSGELTQAKEIADEASELAARAGDLPRARHRIAKLACDVALELGPPWVALERLERETATERNEHQRILLHADLALWTARLKGAGGGAVVREQVAAGHADAEKVGCPRCGGDLLLRSAEALARIGEREEARRALVAWDLSEHRDALDALIRPHTGALVDDDAATRAARLEDVLETAAESPFRLEAVWAQLDVGLALAEAGDDRAAAELERAFSIADELCAGTVQELAQHALRSLGVRTWRRTAAGAPLTEREREVARLVAEGATNREIAQRLFLSPKTIERHVSNVFKKVGVRNRAELVSRLSTREGSRS